jgi:aarF domain-containing kinase
VEAELGAPISDIFTDLDFSSEPIAAASLGQVYRCHLRDGGAEVALKVQRPDMIRAVSLDLYLLRGYMQAVEWVKINIGTRLLGAAERASFDVALLDTFARASYLELDYRNEGRNGERFAREVVPRMGGAVYVPRCEWKATTRKVLATEWIEGVQLAKSPPEVINRLISTGVSCFLTQLLEVGFFHSDPHPGNLLVDKKGRLVLIDFGLCADIKAFDTRHLTGAIVHMMRGDVAALIEDGIILRFLPVHTHAITNKCTHNFHRHTHAHSCSRAFVHTRAHMHMHMRM